MSDSFNIQEAKKISLIQSFNALGYSPSTKMGQKQFRLFLNKKLPSGHFDNMLCNKLFQTLNIGENSSISIQEFVEGFILFEQEILRNAESFKVQLAKEKEIYNKILNQCQIYELKNGAGKVKEYFNGKLKFEGEYLNGERNGKGKEYFNCELEFEGEYLNGKRNGKGKEYFNGILLYEGDYSNGKRNGKGKEYDYNGKLRYEGEYLNGKRNLQNKI